MSLWTESALGVFGSGLTAWAVLGLVTLVAVLGRIIVFLAVLDAVLVVAVGGRVMVVRAVLGLVLVAAVVGRVVIRGPAACFWRSTSKSRWLVYCVAAEK
jgi:hypothetical protein